MIDTVCVRACVCVCVCVCVGVRVCVCVACVFGRCSFISLSVIVCVALLYETVTVRIHTLQEFGCGEIRVHPIFGNSKTAWVTIGRRDIP